VVVESGASGAGDGDVDAGETPPGHSVDEHEPNDSVPRAMPVELPTDGGVRVRGALTAPSSTGTTRPADVDLYRLDGGADRAKRQLRIVLRQAPVAPTPAATEPSDLAIELLDGAGERELLVNDGGPGEPEVLPNVSVHGVRYLRIRAVKPTPAAAPGYLLDLTTVPLGAGDEVEPNDRAAYASPLMPGGEGDGYHGWRHDVDYYRVPLVDVPPGSVLRVDVDGVEGVAASVMVFDSIESQLAEVRGDRGAALVVRSVAVRPGEPHCWVAVRAMAGKNVEQRYSVRVATEVPVGPQELEPNDQVAQATVLGEGGAITGYLLPGDQDWYRLKLPPGASMLRAEVTAPDGTDVKLAAAEGSGRLRSVVDAGGKREPEVLPGLAVQGEVLLKVYGRPKDGNADEPYRLAWTLAANDGGFEIEPNDVPATATPWPQEGGGAASGEVRGFLHPRGDVDCYRLLARGAPGETMVTEQFTVESIPKVRLAMALFDDQRKLIAEVGADPSMSGGGARRLTSTAKAGQRLSLCVRDASGKVSNPRDTYRLVRAAPAAAPPPAP
jgi:hypothetical protein